MLTPSGQQEWISAAGCGEPQAEHQSWGLAFGGSRQQKSQNAMRYLSAACFLGIVAFADASPAAAQQNCACFCRVQGEGGGGCACGRVDVHAHFLPEVYAQALAQAGLTTLDGGFPVPKWSAGAAIDRLLRSR